MCTATNGATHQRYQRHAFLQHTNRFNIMVKMATRLASATMVLVCVHSTHTDVEIQLEACARQTLATMVQVPLVNVESYAMELFQDLLTRNLGTTVLS